MSRQSAPIASVIGTIIAIGLLACLLSRIWVYLVVCGSVALVAWVGWVVARRSSAPSKPSPVSLTGVPDPAPSRDEPLRTLLPVGPKVFDDPAHTKEVALRTFTAWARELPMAPDNPSELVRSLELRAQHIGRLVTVIAERKIVSREAPHRGASPITSPRLTPDTVDPWAFSPADLRNSSLYVASCEPCAGTGEVSCPTCSRTMRIKCTNCNGAGKAYGYTSNGARRLLNCKLCRAKGELQCTACTKGLVACRMCRGTGRLERWLEVEETSRSDVQVTLDREELRAFQWASAGPQLSPAEIAVDARLLGEVTSHGPLTQEKAVEIAPSGWLQENWQKIQTQLRLGERIQTQTLQMFELPRVQLSYSLPGAEPTMLSFEGLRMLVPPRSFDWQFEARAQKIRLTRHIALVISIGVPIVYLLRGSYFWNGWVLGLSVGVAGVAACVSRLMQESTLGRGGARRWAAAVIAATILVCSLAVSAEPSARAAEKHLAAGRIEAARAELIALGDSDKKSHVQLWATVHLMDALQSSNVETVAHNTAQIPEGAAQRAAAEQHLYDLTSRAVLQHLSARDPGAAQRVLAQATPGFQKSASGKALAGQLAELKARVRDEEYAGCTTDGSRWTAAFEAAQMAPSAEREQRLAVARSKVVHALTPQPRTGESARSRLQYLNTVAALAKEIGDARGDGELAARAQAAAAWVRDERRKIPLIGAERSTVADLLGVQPDTDANTFKAVISSVAVHCSMKGEYCMGLYLVGSAKDARVLNDPTHAAATEAILSQALGHQATLPAPPKPVNGKVPTMSKWVDGKVTLVARWRDTSLMELRIGDAKP